MVSMDRIDFQNSSITWLTKNEESYGRFVLESLCSIRDEPTGVTDSYGLGVEVLAGHVYGTEGLVMNPAYLFQFAASKDKHRIFRTYLQHRPGSDSAGRNADLFKEVDLKVVKEAAILLHDFEAIEQHFDKHSPLSARATFIRDGATNIEIEFPVKHINLQRARRLFQVETGPVLFPTEIPPAWNAGNSMPEFNPAFIHFNKLDEIEVTLKVPVRAGLRSTRFYSETRKLQAQVSLLASNQN